MIFLFCLFVLSNAQFYDMDDDSSTFGTNGEYNFYKLDNQWTPMGRSDPLRNDPTFDYLPPVLKKVNYWIDPSLRKPDISEILMNELPQKTTPKIFIKPISPLTTKMFKVPFTKSFYKPLSKTSSLHYSQSPFKTIRNPEMNSLLNFFIEKNLDRKSSASSKEHFVRIRDEDLSTKKSTMTMTISTIKPTVISIIEGHSKVKKYGSLTKINNKKSIKKRDLEIQETEFAAKYNVSKEPTTEVYFKGIVM